MITIHRYSLCASVTRPERTDYGTRLQHSEFRAPSPQRYETLAAPLETRSTARAHSRSQHEYISDRLTEALAAERV